MAPHSSTLAWKTPRTEEPGGLQSMGSLRVTERLHFHFSLSCIGEGNGNPLQYSCLENPRDRRACWAAIYGVTQNRTRLKWLSSSSSIHQNWDVKPLLIGKVGNRTVAIGLDHLWSKPWVWIHSVPWCGYLSLQMLLLLYLGDGAGGCNFQCFYRNPVLAGPPSLLRY